MVDEVGSRVIEHTAAPSLTGTVEEKLVPRMKMLPVRAIGRVLA
jgi:hypothetical protein